MTTWSRARGHTLFRLVVIRIGEVLGRQLSDCVINLEWGDRVPSRACFFSEHVANYLYAAMFYVRGTVVPSVMAVVCRVLP